MLLPVRCSTFVFRSLAAVVAFGLSAPFCTAYAGEDIMPIEVEDGAVSAEWHTLSGLTADPEKATRLFAVADHDSPPHRIFQLKVKDDTAKIEREIKLKGTGGRKLDIEGIAKRKGGFWLVSEGNDEGEPNLLLQVDDDGTIEKFIPLPDEIDDRTGKKGLEGVAVDETSDGTTVYVALQEPLKDDAAAEAKSDTEFRTRVGAYDPDTKEWRFFLYPLSVSGDQAGVSELLHLGSQRFAAIERDGKPGADAKVKLVTTFDLSGLKGAAARKAAPTAKNKRTALDLIGFYARNNRGVDEQIEGLAIAADGQVYAVVDNNENAGTPLLRLGRKEDLFGN
jgi:Esterase-like activity of phytase